MDGSSEKETQLSLSSEQQHSLDEILRQCGILQRASSFPKSAKYLMKDGDVDYFGCSGDDFLHSGKKAKTTDIVYGRILDGEKPIDLLEDEDLVGFLGHNWARINSFAVAMGGKRKMVKRKCVCITGPTGVGKSRCLWELFGGGAFRNPVGGGSWFDGYVGQKVAIFDDFRPESMALPDLL